jgi:hypothetical protein
MARPAKAGAGRNLEKEAFWRETVARWRGSGTTQAEFCRKEHLNENNFSSWKKIIQDRELATIGRKVEPVQRVQPIIAPGRSERPTTFVRLDIAGSPEEAPAEKCKSQSETRLKNIAQPMLAAEIIDLDKGTRLRIYNGADPSTFTALLSAFSRS